MSLLSDLHKLNPKLANHWRSRQGFSLIEIAVVLGVIGLVLGNIWSNLAHQRDADKTTKAAQQIETILQNFKAAYYANNNFLNFGAGGNSFDGYGASPTTDETALFATMGMIPADMMQTIGTSTIATSPWGYPVSTYAYLYQDSHGVIHNAFAIDYGISSTGCTNLLLSNMGSWFKDGLYEVRTVTGDGSNCPLGNCELFGLSAMTPAAVVAACANQSRMRLNFLP